MKILTASHCNKPTLTDDQVSRGFLLLDITVKSGCEDGWVLAPTWDLVNAIQSKSVPWTEFANDYIRLIVQRFQKPTRARDNILAASHLILVCYCPSAEWCHRRLAAHMLQDLYNGKYFGEYIS